ncbi:MAG: sigma-54 interaction domain-containing protein [Candidatus Binatia bacterium]
MTFDTGSTDLGPEGLRARLRWLLLARVLIVTVFLGATGLSHLTPGSDVNFPLRAVAGLIVTAYVFSLASAWAVGRVRDLRLFALCQIAADIVLISAAVLLTGGLGSPMAVWYNLAIIGAAILLLRRGAYAAAALSSLTYGVLMNLVYYQALPSSLVFATGLAEPGFGVVYQIAANIASFFSIAFLSSILAERVVSAELALSESEANLRRMEALQKALVQNIESGIVTTDADGAIRSANQAIETILGKPAGEILGRRLYHLFPVLRPPIGAKRLIDSSAGPIELAHRGRPDGPEQTLRCTSAPLADTYQNVIGALFIFQDITALRAAEPQEPPAELARDDVKMKAKVPPIVGFLGQSQAMAEIAELIHKVAPTESTVLITGESGTGKELAARALHSLSPRRDKAMVVVNCAAIPANLIESELFGHVRGAFTGAVADRKGLFRSADGGTIFLDEVGDLPLHLQVKLLRVLQERSFTPVGAGALVAVNVRIIAATNRDLESEVAAGTFREDLFYRLNVIRIQMPPLRERTEDLPPLIEHFVARFAESLHRPLYKISPAAMKRLLTYGYPGNIRELENVLEHAVALCEQDAITEMDLPADVRDGSVLAPQTAVRKDSEPPGIGWMETRSSNLDAELETLERKFLDEALRRAGGIRKRAAEILGINYRSLRHRLSKYGYGDPDSKDFQN